MSNLTNKEGQTFSAVVSGAEYEVYVLSHQLMNDLIADPDGWITYSMVFKVNSGDTERSKRAVKRSMRDMFYGHRHLQMSAHRREFAVYVLATVQCSTE